MAVFGCLRRSVRSEGPVSRTPNGDAALEARPRSALFRNNRDRTFSDVTDKTGIAHPCWANGAVVGDYNNDGRADLLVAGYQSRSLYRNEGGGTFKEVPFPQVPGAWSTSER